jgi:DNA-binding CsgD family transcriptional regulator
VGRTDLVGIVEAAYAVNRDAHAWLQAVVDVAVPVFDQGLGGAGIVADASGAVPTPARNLDFAMSGLSMRTLETLQPLGEVAASPEISGRFRRSGSVGTFHKTLGAEGRDVMKVIEPRGISDSLYLMIGDPSALHCTFAFPSPEKVALSPKFKRSAAHISAHVEAGFRMLSRAWVSTPDAMADGTEAVLDPSGRVEHAEGDARDAASRDALREAVLRAESARGRMRREDPERAVAYWRALVAGRWSVVDHFDTDGRRYLLARPNEPRGTRMPALAPREAQVVELASRGHALKLIAYELGLSVSTVSSHLRSGMAKLGIRSRSELIYVLAARRRAEAHE